MTEPTYNAAHFTDVEQLSTLKKQKPEGDLMFVCLKIHEMLDEIGVEKEGSLTGRVKLALTRMQTAENRLDDLQHDIGVFTFAGTYLDSGDVESLRSEDTAELCATLQQAKDRQIMLQYSAREWKAAAKAFRRRWREMCAEVEDPEEINDRAEFLAEIARLVAPHTQAGETPLDTLKRVFSEVAK